MRWRECVLAMKALGVTKLYELGAGKVLTGLVKRIDQEIEASSVGAPADIEAALKALQLKKEQHCMFDLSGKTRAGHRRLRRHRRRDRAGAARAGRATSASAARGPSRWRS